MLRVRPDKAIKSNATWKRCGRRHHRLPQKSAVQSVRAWQLSEHAKHTRGLTPSKTSITTHACYANTTPWSPPALVQRPRLAPSRRVTPVAYNVGVANPAACAVPSSRPTRASRRLVRVRRRLCRGCCCHHHRCFPVFMLFGRSTHCSHVSSNAHRVERMLIPCPLLVQVTLPIPL